MYVLKENDCFQTVLKFHISSVTDYYLRYSSVINAIASINIVLVQPLCVCAMLIPLIKYMDKSFTIYKRRTDQISLPISHSNCPFSRICYSKHTMSLFSVTNAKLKKVICINSFVLIWLCLNTSLHSCSSGPSPHDILCSACLDKTTGLDDFSTQLFIHIYINVSA